MPTSTTRGKNGAKSVQFSHGGQFPPNRRKRPSLQPAEHLHLSQKYSLSNMSLQPHLCAQRVEPHQLLGSSKNPTGSVYFLLLLSGGRPQGQEKKEAMLLTHFLSKEKKASKRLFAKRKPTRPCCKHTHTPSWLVPMRKGRFFTSEAAFTPSGRKEGVPCPPSPRMGQG